MENAIRVEQLRKSYGKRVVLKDVSFRVRQGECFALLGGNGAGKTTTLECMEGLKRYDGGNIIVNGKAGIQLQSAALPEYIKAAEALRLFAKWNHQAFHPHSRGFLSGQDDALGIGAFAQKQYYQLSTGQKRRLHLALALLSDPDIIFLDEPTAGLDVEGRIALHEQIRQLKKKGKTLILASHDMAEVESLCDRIAILRDGNIAFVGTVEELNAQLGKRYDISVKTSTGTEHLESDRIGETLLKLLSRYQETGTEILDIRVSRGSLEQQLERNCFRKKRRN
ncbi:MAG: ABC transporter ATP-binding protein [bacterium]|nr:ABC transporter ATP-binding protein [bacterium]